MNLLGRELELNNSSQDLFGQRVGKALLNQYPIVQVLEPSLQWILLWTAGQADISKVAESQSG